MRTTKKQIIKIATCAVLAIVLGGVLWYALVGGIKMIPFSQEEIVLVEITNGNTGEMIELSEEEIATLLEVCEPITCKWMYRRPYGGWGYSVWIEGESKNRSITFSGETMCDVNGTKYRIDPEQGAEVIKLIESFYTNQ